MRTASRHALLVVIVMWALVTSIPVGAQMLGEGEGAVANPANPFTPPPCTTPVFNDVPCSNYFSAWIGQLYTDQVSTGCPYPNFCPDAYVTRGQMAAFLERAMRGTSNWSPGDLGSNNTGLGNGALLNNSPFAEANTAVGSGALLSQSYTAGDNAYTAANTAIGFHALYSNQPDAGFPDGTLNTAVGASSLASNSDGWGNTAVGVQSMLNLSFGYEETAVGSDAGALRQYGYADTFLGASTDAAAEYLTDATAIGFGAVVDNSYHVRIGDTGVTQIGGQVGWSNLSDIRAKTNVVPLDLGLAFVMALQPVSFTLKQGNGRTDMGFIAQDVEALLGDGYNVLGIGGDKDRTLSLRYTDFIAPMVKAIQEQEATIIAEQAQIDSQKADMAARDARIQNLESDVAALKAQVQALVAVQAGGATKTAR